MTNPAVLARDLEMSYGDIPAIASSDFTLPSPGLSVLIGPNGSGKSTLLAAMAGLQKPVAGTITVLGVTPIQARSRVALVPQSTKVNETLPVTVGEVVGMGRYAALGMVGRFGREDRQAVSEAIERLDLVNLAGRHLSELSGGQRQRVFVAQGLVQERDLLLLDEPTTALDLVSAHTIRQVIVGEVADGRPVVLTTHDLGEAMAADHVLLLSNRVVAEGPPDQVLTPESLAVAYDLDVSEVSDGFHLDDAAHRPAGIRHVHGES
ncbi:MAG: metal ABC transporter ATP-binding protein [Acidimicrobiia bacterium]